LPQHPLLRHPVPGRPGGQHRPEPLVSGAGRRVAVPAHDRGDAAMADEHAENALDSASPESRERAAAPGSEAAKEHPGQGPALAFDDDPDQERQVDGAADTGPGTRPEGATPKVPRTSGDPLADAHEDHGRQP
jgi:hypothetical protein